MERKPRSYKTVKMYDDDQKTLKGLAKDSGLSQPELLSFSIKFVPWNTVCSICGQKFIDHAFIFNHEFKG